jgi:hypothetical protein
VEYAAAFAAVFAINLLPAFGPPTWAVLVFFRLSYGLAAVPLILGGAVAAASGRLTLAAVARRFRSRMSPERLRSLAAAEEALTASRGRAWTGLGLFAISPLPSAQLFVAAGLLTVPLVPLTAAFFAGRLVSYTIYVAVASAAAHSLRGVLEKTVASPLGIALELGMLVLLVVLYRVDWTRLLKRSGAEPATGSDQPADALRGTTSTGQSPAPTTAAETLPSSTRRTGP